MNCSVAQPGGKSGQVRVRLPEQAVLLGTRSTCEGLVAEGARFADASRGRLYGVPAAARRVPGTHLELAKLGAQVAQLAATLQHLSIKHISHARSVTLQYKKSTAA